MEHGEGGLVSRIVCVVRNAAAMWEKTAGEEG